MLCRKASNPTETRFDDRMIRAAAPWRRLWAKKKRRGLRCRSVAG